MNIKVVKYCDSLIGSCLVNLFSSLACRDEIASLHSILLIRPGGIGDAVLLIPVTRAIKNRYPEAQIDVLAEKRNSGVFSLSPDIRDIYHYDRPKELWKTLRNRYDVVIDTEQWHRLSAVVARLTRARVSIGYATNERKKLFNYQIPYSHDDYEAESFLHLIEPIVGNVVFEPGAPFLSISPELVDKARASLSSLSGRRLVAVFPGGSIPERRWGAERFRRVAVELAGKGYGVVVVGGKEDVADGAAISKEIPGAVDLCGRLSLPETAAVLNEVDLLITGDSGIMHIACGLGKKVLALFGPGIEKKWAHRGGSCAVINKGLDCSPCTKFGYTPNCRKGAECMRLITIDEVVEKATALLEQE